MSKYVLQVRNVSKYYGSHLAVDDVSFDVETGSFSTILGPSGCGKTTTLRMIAGFENADRGKIILNGEEVQNSAPYDRSVNTVFQSYALFPHMTVSQNIAYGLQNSKISDSEITQRVDDAQILIDLPNHGHRYPKQLSGGQRQRVALARAFVNRPDLLLLDEPLGALDLRLRQQMQDELKRLQQELGIAFLYVTHDQEEALTMSDQVIIMNHSVVEQIDDPVTLYNRPQTAFVADFLGGANLVEPGQIEETSSGHRIDFCGTEILLTDTGHSADGQKKLAVIRPEKLKLPPSSTNSNYRLSGNISAVTFKGTYYEISVVLNNGTTLLAKSILADEIYQPGQDVELGFEASDIALVDADGRSQQ